MELCVNAIIIRKCVIGDTAEQHPVLANIVITIAAGMILEALLPEKMLACGILNVVGFRPIGPIQGML